MERQHGSGRDRRGRLALPLLLLLATTFLSLAALELANRFILARANDLPLGFSIEELVYPSLSSGLEGYSPEGRNVLLLGGSALRAVGESEAFASVFESDDIRFYNVATDAHTSLDSRYKYQYLSDRGYRFDDVVFYHAINEVRANNVPEELFSASYDHYAFYRLSNLVFSRAGGLTHAIARTTLGHRALSISIPITASGQLVPENAPNPDWVAHGRRVKTAPSFRANLRAVKTMAEANGTRLIVPVFAFHLAQGYSLDAYRNNRLAYVDEPGLGVAIELWGSPANVVNGIVAHNDVIRSEIRHPVATHFISDDVGNFVDICHLSHAGIVRFGELIRKALANSHGPDA